MTSPNSDEIHAATTHFEATGEVLPCLLVGFDQDGEWIPHWEYETGLDLPMMRDVILNVTAIYEKDKEGGLHLKTSYVIGGDGSINIDLISIGGNLETGGHTFVRAPKLKSIGHNATFIGAIELGLDELESIGGDLFSSLSSTTNFPKLRSTGNISLPLCEKLYAPKLTTIGRNIHLPMLENKERMYRKISEENLQKIAQDELRSPLPSEIQTQSLARKELLRRSLAKKEPLELTQ